MSGAKLGQGVGEGVAGGVALGVPLTAQERFTATAFGRLAVYKQTAQAARIDRATFYRWLAKGREPAAPKEYRDFYDALTRAQAEAEVHAVGVIRDAMPHDWRAAIAYLERRCEGWRRRDRVEHTAKDEAPVSLKLPDHAGPAAHAFLRAVRDHGG